MTQGAPLKKILVFSFPLLIGNLFQQMYSMVDMLLVGRFLGADALAAVGCVDSFSFLIVGALIGLTGGFSVIIAQRFGAGNHDAVRSACVAACYLGIAFSVLLTLISTVFCAPLLRLVHTPENIFDMAHCYLFLTFCGLFATMLYDLVAGILRAVGDSRTPLYFLIFASFLNIVLDILFIQAFHWGVAGAAIATVVSQLISGVFCLIYALKKFPWLRVCSEDLRPEKSLYFEHLRMGLSTAMQCSIIAIGSIVIQGKINNLGSSAIAAYTAGCKAEQFFSQPFGSAGLATATYCAQNKGAQQLGRIQTGVRQIVIFMLLLCIVLSGGLLIFGKEIVACFFRDADDVILSMAVLYMNRSALFFPSLALLFIYRNALQGLGNAAAPFWGGVCELIMRVVAALILVPLFGFNGLCWASPLAWFGSAVPLCLLYYANMRRLQ